MSTKTAWWILFLIYNINVCLSHDEPRVKTPLGEIRGTWKTSFDGKTYGAFEGIPYAKPPVGDLRFEEPQPVDPWPGVWDATTLYTCIQHAAFTPGGSIEGNEDCLYINVFVPAEKLNRQENVDVFVFIHGGGFMVGSAHQLASSKYVMDRDIIFVSFNYRLGSLGFLSTEDEVVPGNNGMKDQVLALKWVKENIASFGGNPNAITISGLSAGGASVHLHYFSPLSKGLFVRGLSQSGTAVDPWAIKEKPLENARKLGALVGCDYSSTQQLKECLKKRPAALLIEKQKFFLEYDRLPFASFAPVIETGSERPFLAEDPYLILKQNKVLDVPWIVSICADEGLLPAAYYYGKLDEVDGEWSRVAQYFLEYSSTLPVSKRAEVAEQIKDFYLGSGQHIAKENFKKFTQIMTDRLFAVGAETAAKLQSKSNKSPVYFYFFNYKESANQMTRFYTTEKGVEGVAHGQDSAYVYGSLAFVDYSEKDKRLKNKFQDMLYSYITTGIPTFDGIDEWQPTEASELTYLNITGPEDIKLQTTKFLTPLEFWRNLGLSEYENFNNIKTEL